MPLSKSMTVGMGRPDLARPNFKADILRDAPGIFRPLFPAMAFLSLFSSMLFGIPGAHAETFNFESKTSLPSYTATIGGELLFPTGAGRFPVVILLHTCGGLQPVPKAAFSAHAQALRKAGFATYILDSFTARKIKPETVCADGREAAEARLDDVFNARDALQKHPRVDKGKFFVAGASHGAGVALSAAVNLADREPFRAVVAFYPWCGNVSHPGIVWKSPVMVFGAEKDDWTPVRLCEQVKQRERPTGEQFELIVYPNAYHAFDQQGATRKVFGHTLGYDEAATADSRKKMVEFFLRNLGRGS